ncbi:MarR family winged helix-turn-helix transcriptional regulator [Nitrospirillum amazonense]|nr:MarR family transcriptional regulator [Nitrospirillum amazonense]MDG3439558.1 MarR family transcriptional regulator [Nitrospirillum amazonense]
MKQKIVSHETHYRTSANENMKLENHLCFALYAALHSYNNIYKLHLDPLELTYPQYLVMLVLWERDDLTVKELGRRLRLDSGTLTPLLKRLEAAGRLRRTRDPKNERQVRITLTGEGHALKGSTAAVPTEINLATGLEERRLEDLRVDLNNLRFSLEARHRRKATSKPD